MRIAHLATFLTLLTCQAEANNLLFEPQAIPRFYSALSDIKNKPADILVIGDSLTVGLGSTYPDQQSWPSVFRRILQAKLNPEGVVGGAGFVPVRYTWGGTIPQPMTVLGNAPAFIGRDMPNVANVTAWLNAEAVPTSRVTWSGAGVTSLESLVSRQSGVTANCRSVVTGSGLTQNATISVSGSGPRNSGSRTLIAAKLKPSQTVTASIYAPTQDKLRLSGLVRYNGDESCGIRVQNLACSGISLFESMGYTSYFRSSEPLGIGPNTSLILSANIDAWPSAKLVILALGTNDQGNYGTTLSAVQNGGKSTFKAHLEVLVDYIQQRGIDVVLAVMPAPGGGREALYRQMIVDSVHEVASVRTNITLMDFDYALGRGPYASLPAGWSLGDNLHYQPAANSWFGTQAAYAFLEGF